MTFTFDRLAPGSVVLVTGATGLVGSAVTIALLERGYKVRAVTRSIPKSDEFRQSLDSRFGAGKVQFVEVKDYTQPNVWDGLLHGVEGVLHVATDSSFSPKFEEVVPAVEAAILTLLKAAAKAQSVKSFVLTSSRVAVFNPQVGQDVHATVNDWADYFVDLAKNVKEDDPSAPGIVYGASKVLGERKAWEFVEKEKPGFAFNVVLPDYVAGPVFNPAPGIYSTHTFLNELFQGDNNSFAVVFLKPASRLVDSRDVAAVHVAALTATKANGQRWWGAPHKLSINKILAIWREAFPDRKILPDFDSPQPDINIDDEASNELLRAFKGTDWYTLKESVIANVQEML